jgi:hypothetical protein
MGRRQFQVETPIEEGPEARVTWAMNELEVLMTAGAATDDVVTRGGIFGGQKDQMFYGGLHIRRGRLSGLSVSITSRSTRRAGVGVTVIPTSTVQTHLLILVFLGAACLGGAVGYGSGQSYAVVDAFVGLLLGAVVGVGGIAFIQRFGIGVAGDAAAAADALAADIGQWVEQRGRHN